MSLEGRRIVVVGASGVGTGARTAWAASAAGAEVVIAARSEEGLAAVQQRLDQPAEQHVLDMLDHDAVERWFAALGGIDHVAITADPGRAGPFLEQSVEEAHTKMGKFWGQFHVARSAALRLRPGGSLVLGSSVAAVAPARTGAILTAVNAAISGLTIGLARELGPLRVNAVAPSWMIAEDSDPDQAQQAREWAATSLPTGHPGSPDQVAAAILYLMDAKDVTGVVLPIDGGLRVIS